MLIDLLTLDNYLSFNVKLAHLIGLNASIYCSELLNIVKKAQKKNKMIDDEYVKVDRKYIFEKTTLHIEDQLVVDCNLAKIKLITKKPDNPDIIKLDVDLLASLINEDDVKLTKSIQERTKATSPRGVKESARQREIAEVKESIPITNYELLTALREWVDAIFNNPKIGYLSKTAVRLFVETLNNYTKGDLDLALRIVHICTIQCYRDCNWGISTYEHDLALAKSRPQIQSNNVVNQTVAKVSEQKKATKLSDTIF
jgi:hypothetical protein